MAFNLQTLSRLRGLSTEQVELLRDLRGLTSDGVRALPETAMRRALRRQDYADMPRARRAYRRDQARDDTGALPKQPLVTALRQLDSLRLRASPRMSAGVPVGGAVAPASLTPPPPAAGLNHNQWRAIGPDNIGGRTRSILADPQNPNRLWAGSVAGGVWRSDDGGAHWAAADDFMASLSVTSMVMDPAHHPRIYVGTGEGFGNVDALRGGGIFTSDDGVAWRQIQATVGPKWATVNKLAISADGTTLLAARGDAIMRSTDPARATWTAVLNAAVADIKFHPTDPKRAIAGSMSSGQAWFTTDGGATWTVATRTGPGRRVNLCYAAAKPDTVYASVDNGGGEIWRSTNGGKTYAKRRALNPDGQATRYLGDQGWYANVVWAGDPTNANLVIAGGLDLWRSTNGGDSFVDISTWWDDRSAHADQHVIVAHGQYNGGTNRTVYFGNDGGIYRAADITTVGADAALPRVTGWSSLNQGYTVSQFYGACVFDGSGVIVGGLQDNGTAAFDPNAGPGAWRKVFGGDGGYCSSDPTDGKVFYGEYVYLGIFRNEDGAMTDDVNGDRYITGQFWNAATSKWDWKPDPFRIPDAFNQDALFIAPFVLDRRNPARLFAGGSSLWRTDDAKAPNTPTSGPRWSRIKPPSNGKISAIAIDPASSDRVWVGHEDGELWCSPNGTAAQPGWSLMSGQGAHPLTAGRFCTQILVSPHDPKKVFVTFGGYQSGNIWASRDQGATWANLGAALPAAPVRAVSIHPQHPDWIYIGSEVGLFASEDGGASWSPTNEGPANVSVEDLFWTGATLVCATHGRGVFTINIP
jgi:hypothetical protein